MLRLLSVLALALGIAPSAYAAGDAAAGKKNFDMLCFTCHGMTGKGDGPAGAALTPPPRDFSKTNFMIMSPGQARLGDRALFQVNVPPNADIRMS